MMVVLSAVLTKRRRQINRLNDAGAWSDGKKVSGIRCQHYRRPKKSRSYCKSNSKKRILRRRIKFEKLPLTDLIVGAVCNRDGLGLASAENRGN